VRAPRPVAPLASSRYLPSLRDSVYAHAVGVVNKVGVDHIGLLVLGAFNASIALEQTAGAFEEHEAEVRRPGSLRTASTAGRRTGFLSVGD